MPAAMWRGALGNDAAIQPGKASGVRLGRRLSAQKSGPSAKQLRPVWREMPGLAPGTGVEPAISRNRSGKLTVSSVWFSRQGKSVAKAKLRNAALVGTIGQTTPTRGISAGGAADSMAERDRKADYATMLGRKGRPSGRFGFRYMGGDRVHQRRRKTIIGLKPEFLEARSDAGHL